MGRSFMVILELICGLFVLKMKTNLLLISYKFSKSGLFNGPCSDSVTFKETHIAACFKIEFQSADFLDISKSRL